MTRPASHNYPANWPERDAPWHCGQCAGGWDCTDCHRLFSQEGDPSLITNKPERVDEFGADVLAILQGA